MIELAFFDIDGVLTDGMIYIDSQGNEIKRISFDDIDAIFELKRAGIKIGFISGERNSFTDYVKRRFEPDFFIVGEKNKLSAYKKIEKEFHLNSSKVSFTGDTKKDIELLEYLTYSFAPSNVDDDVKKASKYVVDSPRGNGVIKDVARFIINMESVKRFV